MTRGGVGPGEMDFFFHFNFPFFDFNKLVAHSDCKLYSNDPNPTEKQRLFLFSYNSSQFSRFPILFLFIIQGFWIEFLFCSIILFLEN